MSTWTSFWDHCDMSGTLFGIVLWSVNWYIFHLGSSAETLFNPIPYKPLVHKGRHLVSHLIFWNQRLEAIYGIYITFFSSKYWLSMHILKKIRFPLIFHLKILRILHFFKYSDFLKSLTKNSVWFPKFHYFIISNYGLMAEATIVMVQVSRFEPFFLIQNV